MNDVTVPNENKSVAVVDTLVPRTLAEVKDLATFLCASDMIPEYLRGRKENVAMILLMGHEIGCGGIAALRNIYVVKNRPSIYGDLATALVRRSGLCEELEFKFEGTGAALKCIATGKRKGVKTSHTEEYSWEDAVCGGLVEKNPTYKKHPKDMIMWKALHRLYKFLWPDVLNGMSIKEIAADDVIEAEVEVMEKVEVLGPAAKAPAAPAEPTMTATMTADELKAKEEAAKAKKADLEAKEKAKAEKKAAKEAKAAEAPAEAPPAPEETVPADEPVETVAEPVNRVYGTLVDPVKLSDNGVPKGFALKMETEDGIEKFALADLAAAQEAKKFKGKTLEIFWEPLVPPLEGVKGKVTSYKAVNP